MTKSTAKTARHRVEDHFERREPVVGAIYRTLLAAARKLGPVVEDPKKTSIHLVRSTVFAGVGTRRSALILTLKADEDYPSPRIVKRERASARRWYLYVRLETPSQVDGEIRRWLRRAYELSA